MTLPAERDAPISQDLETLQESWNELCSQYVKLGTSPNDTRRETIYQILVSSPETAGFVHLVDQFPEIRSALQHAGSVHTVWVPINSYFGTIDQEHLFSYLNTLRHHISPHWMPLQRILSTPNIPTLVQPDTLNGDLRMRLRPPISVRAGNIMKVNSEATITQSDIFGINGVIHLLDKPLLLPSSTQQVIMQLPTSQFSMFQLGLRKTGLAEEIMSKKFVGITIFAPTNDAFCDLGTSSNEFLFQSDEGCEYLRALLKFHVAPQHTLLSNAYYTDTGLLHRQPAEPQAVGNRPDTGPDGRETPRTIRGRQHFTLPTMLSLQRLNVDIARCEGLISMRIREGQAPVTVQDLIGMDGVVHVLSRVALPGQSDPTVPQEMSIDEFKKILKDYS